MTNSDSKGAVSMPPTMGAAMRLITSLPVPLSSRIGNRPAMITATVMALGRTRCTAPSRIAASSPRSLPSPDSWRSAQAFFRYSSMITPNSADTPARAIKPTPVATDRLNPSQ